MNKLIICLAGCLLLAAHCLQAQDAEKKTPDSSRQVSDSTKQPADNATHVQDSAKKAKDTSILQPVDTTSPKPQDAPAQPAQDSSVKVQDAPAAPVNDGMRTDDSHQAPDTAKRQEPEQTKRELDTRWFISPLLKMQFQDFAMIEKDRKGYLSDANTLPFLSRGNGSFAASAYKNVTNRLSISADLGLSFGHSTNDSVLISQTTSRTYNLLNATVFYHLLSPGYRLQPFISLGINDIVSNASYLSAPIGFGAKFNSKKIMVMGQFAYGYAVSKNIATTTMYSLGIYLPIGNKKKKQDTIAQDNSAYNRAVNAKKDSAKNGGIVNNFYITIKMDSLNNRKKGGDDDPLSDYEHGGANGGHRKKGGSGSGDDDASSSDKPFKLEDSRVDTVDGKPVYRFFVYFEFNQYSLNSKAFQTVDAAIGELHDNPGMKILINGYTDDIGTVHQNNFISRKRSQMVFDYMNSRGIGSERMVPKFFGKDNPVASNEDPNTSWLNRRVEIIVQDKIPD